MLLIFTPTLREESLSKLLIPTFYNEYFLVESDAVSSFPGRHIRTIIFLLFSFLFLFLTFFIIIILILILFLHYSRRFGFIFEASQLLICKVTKIFAGFVLSLSIYLSLQFLFDLGQLQRSVQSIQLISSKGVHELLSFIESGKQGDNLVSKKY